MYTLERRIDTLDGVKNVLRQVQIGPETSLFAVARSISRREGRVVRAIESTFHIIFVSFHLPGGQQPHTSILLYKQCIVPYIHRKL